MKAKELAGLSSEELIQKEKSLKKELFALNYERKLGRADKPHRFKLYKKDVARILTILKERQLDGTKNK